MRLYHMPGSRSTRVLWMLEEIGVPYEVALMTREERKTAEHIDRHPQEVTPERWRGFWLESGAGPGDPFNQRAASQRVERRAPWIHGRRCRATATLGRCARNSGQVHTRSSGAR
jgi:Glutathione S-transferase, N-terminal domain